MTTSISCVNFKGGVGKTAIAVNLAAYSGQQPIRTLLVDVDPQANATFSMMSVDAWDEHVTNHGSLADLFGLRDHLRAEAKDISARDVIVSEVFPSVDLIPSHPDLFTVDLDIGNKTLKEFILRKKLKDIVDDYELIIFDCPPNFTLPTQNAIAASTDYITPISPDFLSSLGIGLLISRIKQYCDDIDHPVEQAGIILSRIGRRSIHREVTTASLRHKFEGLVFDSEIHERSIVSEAVEAQKPVYDMNNAEAKREFSDVSLEILRRVGLLS